ncbi:MAG: hypothetical protein AB6733_18685 [Clostridiaceae bacterium]
MNISVELIKALLWEWRYVIVFVVFMVLFSWSWFKGKAYKYMMLAKSLAKDAVLNSGAEQEQWVIDTLYKLLPKPIQLITSQDQFNYVMRIIVHRLYIKAKDYLDNGILDNSITDNSTQ